MHEELPTVPTDIAKIVGEFMASRNWKETGKKLKL
jgi:hypothetical protein